MSDYELKPMVVDDLFAYIYLCRRPTSLSNEKRKQELIKLARETGGIYVHKGKEYISQQWIEENKWPLRMQLWRNLPPTMPLELRQRRTVYHRIDRAFKRVCPMFLAPEEEEKFFLEFARIIWKNKDTLANRKELLIQESASGFSIFYIEQEYLRSIKRKFQEMGVPPDPPPIEHIPTQKRVPRFEDELSGEEFLRFIGED